MKLVKFVASGFGLGYLPKSPGTYASLGTVILLKYLNINNFEQLLYIIFSLAMLGWSSLYYLPSNLTKIDPSWITIDEILGQCVTFVGFYPNFPLTWSNFLIAFVLFRFFDILKPFPVNYADKIKSLHGIMIDDIIAGLWGAAIILTVTKILT